MSADELAHQAYEPGTPTFGRLVQSFGPAIVGPDGSLAAQCALRCAFRAALTAARAAGRVDRKRLGATVFGSPQRLQELNAIVWPAVGALVRSELEAKAAARAGPCVAVVEVARACALAGRCRRHLSLCDPASRPAVLVEAGWDVMFDEVWMTWVTDAEALRRLGERDGLKPADALTRVRAQLPAATKWERAHVVIPTGGPMEETRGVLRRRFAELCSRAGLAPGPQAEVAA